MRYSGLDRPDNFEGRWHLYVAEDSPEEIARKSSRDPGEVERNLQSAREKTVHWREERRVTARAAMTRS